MTLAERLQAMEQLWDSLIREPGELASPEWHGEVVTGRIEKIAQGNAKFVDLDEVKRRFAR